MKKYGKYIIPFILFLTLVLVLGIIIKHYFTKAYNLSEIQAAQYDIYEIDVSQIPQDGNLSVKNNILSLCTLQSTEQVGTAAVSIYATQTLSAYLPYCRSITEISTINTYLYVSYNSTDSKEVILCYDDYGLREMTVYDAATDTAFIEIDGVAQIHKDFRKGNQ